MLTLKTVIDSLDSRHTAAQPILTALADGKEVKPADIDALDSTFGQVAPLLQKINEGKAVTQADIDALDSFTGQRLRTVLEGLSRPIKRVAKPRPRRIARKK